MILHVKPFHGYSCLAIRYYTCFALKERGTRIQQSFTSKDFHQNSERPIRISEKTQVKSWKSIKKSLWEYSIVGSIFHVSTSLLLFGSCYIVVTRFGQIEGVLEKFNSLDSMSATPGLNFIVSLGIFKSLFPLRAACTALGTWSIVRYYRCRKNKKTSILSKGQNV